MIPIREIMTSPAITVKPETPIYEAMQLLRKHRISGLPVVDEDDHVAGILSEKDVLRLLVDKKVDFRRPVEEYMSRHVICFQEDDDALDVCRFFMKNPIRRVPVVRDGRLVGVVSRHDIVELILEVNSRIDMLRFT